MNCPPQTVFAAYSDVLSWPKWDSEVVDAQLSSGLTLGAAGYLKPKGGPKTTIKVVEVTQCRSFTIQSRLPLCIMQFGHEVIAVNGGTDVTHWVRFSGPLAFLFRRIIGAGINRTLPDTLKGLKRFCETSAAFP